MSTPRAKSNFEEGKMNDFSEGSFRIRPVLPEDLPELLAMIRELAVFEKLESQFVATEEAFHRALFGERPAVEALLAESGGKVVGYAIFFSTFSTFLGRSGLWLEDLYVRPEHRGRGFGKALLKAVGTLARDRGAGRYEWTVLDWNRRAIELYEQSGAEILPDWRIVRMDRDRLGRFLGS